MGVLANRKWEIFAAAIAAGDPLVVAYEAAGYKPGYSSRFNASRLRNSPPVKERIEEWLAQHAERAVVSIGWIEAQLLDVARAREPSKITINAAGEQEKVYDRAAALAQLAKIRGVGGDITVNTIAQASASAEVAVSDMSSAELARRISFIIEEAAHAGDTIDVTPTEAPSIDRPPAALPPPRERAMAVVKDVVRLAQELRGDRDTLMWLGGMLDQARDAVRAAAGA